MMQHIVVFVFALAFDGHRVTVYDKLQHVVKRVAWPAHSKPPRVGIYCDYSNGEVAFFPNQFSGATCPLLPPQGKPE